MPSELGQSMAALLLQREVEAFLFQEAALLDDWRLDEWLELFTDEARYVVPATDAREGDLRETLSIINDDMARLRGRVERLKSRHAHREFPWSRTRRLITNVRITEATQEEIRVTASFLVYRIRSGHVDPLIGRYDYTLRRVDGGLKVAYRKATLDLEALHPHGTISIIL
ncbi:MAG TPA: aromatic-ring-hydroxylating dioxygenase subunit beta [Verrucomicrobiae bacterium]|nr:aromatic-ring-hydroxylating dioxygenase subunit beta [Verrucomicrobiae bacterium]